MQFQLTLADKGYKGRVDSITAPKQRPPPLLKTMDGFLTDRSSGQDARFNDPHPLMHVAETNRDEDPTQGWNAGDFPVTTKASAAPHDDSFGFKTGSVEQSYHMKDGINAFASARNFGNNLQTIDAARVRYESSREFDLQEASV